MPGTENPNLPTYGLSEAAVEERQPEVPNASFEGGGNEAASNSPGIGINTGDYDPKPSDWPREERAPQTFGHIGLAPLLAGDIRVDNDMPDEAAFFIQAAGPALPGELIPGTDAVNNTGVTIPSGAWLWAPGTGGINSLIALFENGLYGGGLWIAKRLINGTQNLYQDAAGTIPVVADGDPVGLIIDSSGNGNHLIQTVAGSRPTYKTDGTYEWLLPDGIDDSMVTAGSVDMKGSAESTMFCATEIPPTDIPGRMLELGPNATTNRTAMFYTRDPDRTMYRHGGSVILDVSTANSDYGRNRVSSGRASIATPISEQYFYGVFKNSSTATQGSGVISNNLVYLMATDTGAAPLSVPFFGAMLISRYLNDAQMAQVNNYFEGLLPPPSPIVIDDNVTYELDTNDASGWVDDDANDPATVVDGALVFNSGILGSNGWNKTVVGPTSGDYIFIVKLSSTDAGAPMTLRLGTLAGEKFSVSLGYNWATPGPELSRVSAQIGGVGFAGPLSATTGAIVEVAIQYDSRLGVGNFFMREGGAWKFYGNAAMPTPYDNTLRVLTGGNSSSVLTVHEAFFCKPNFVSIGDSISKGATLFDPNPAGYPGIDNYDSTWMAHCNIYPELRNNLIVDYGVGGQSSAQINSRMNAMLNATSPKIVFLHASTNDYGDSIPFATRTSNIQSSVDKINGAGAYAVMLNAVYSNAGHPDWPAHADYAIEWWTDYRDQITGTYSNVDIMGASGILDGSYMNVIYTQSDGVHPNPAGYTLIGQTVALTDLPDSEAP